MVNFIRIVNRLPIKQIYTSNNWFFITICTNQRRCIFVEEGSSLHKTLNQNDAKFELNYFGKVIEQTWKSLSTKYPNVILDQYVVMPNHFHAIIGLQKELNDINLSNIMGYFKAFTQKIIREHIKNIYSKVCDNNGDVKSPLPSKFNYHKIWQKSFYDHIIRNEADLKRIREYIVNNPLQWELDVLNPINDEKFKARFGL